MIRPTLFSLFTLALFAGGTTTVAQDCSVEALATLTTQMWGGEISYTISDDNGVLASGQDFADYSTSTSLFCIDQASGCFVLEMNDSFGDGWNDAFLEISIPVLGISLGSFTLEDGDAQSISFGEGCDSLVVDIEGCTDPAAFNYDVFATVDDGTCSYDCECDDVYEPVCGIDYLTGIYTTYNNLCEAECDQAWVLADGDCADQPVYGCTDEEALNYNPDATDDDGSCMVMPVCEDNQVLAVATLNTGFWGGEVSFIISNDEGVLLEGQGFADDATTEGYFCLDDSAGCLVLTMMDSFGDGWEGGSLEVTVPSMDLSLGTFTLEQGAIQSFSFGLDCVTEVVEVEGCTDPFAVNYDVFATVDDGTCSYDCECDDVYEPVCAFNHLTGQFTTFNNPCEAECAQAWIFAEGTCEDQPVYGCTDMEALNYNPEATEDDGSCIEVADCGSDEVQILVTLQTAIWGSEVSYVISNENGVLAEGLGPNDNSVSYASFCLSDSSGCLELEMIDSFGDGWNGAFIDVSIPDLGISLGTFGLEEGFYQAVSFGQECETEVIQTEGCTDPFAFNYNPYATLDDGSCSYECECEDVYEPVCGYDYATGGYTTFNNACEASCAQAWILWEGDCADQPIYGCTDEESVNYNPEATEDDGSCVTIPVCGSDETAVAIEINSNDSLTNLGFYNSIYWSLTDASGVHVDLVYDYSQFEMASAYGCLADGCYNFYMYDYGWEPGWANVDVSLGDQTTTYVFPENQLEAAYAIGVNTTDCEVFLPVYGCMDEEAMNYNPDANIEDGYCLYPCECEDVYEPVCGYDYFTGDYVTFNNPCEAECWNAWIVWDGDCADQPIYGCTDPEALNYNPEATDDDGSCAIIPVCGEGESEVIFQTLGTDSLDVFGGGVSLYWTLTTDLGGYINLVFDYNDVQTTSYGCLADGCYNFYLNDYGWIPGMGSVEVLLNGEAMTYSVPEGEYNAVFALGVNTEGCEVTTPGCTDPDALNYNPLATVDDGLCQYPFVCETGEVGYVYLYAPAGAITLDIVSDAGELVFSQNDIFNFGSVYGEVCLEPNMCYTAVATGDVGDDLAWSDALFGVSTAFEDIAYEAWPVGEDAWAVQFSLDGTCGEMDSDWEAFFGCTDEEATNYSPDALLDDGSCIFSSFCELVEVEFVLDGGLMPDEVGLKVTNEAGDLLMEMDGYTGSSIGCVPEGCYKVEMLDASGDGWNGAMAEFFVDGDYSGSMTLEEGDYELQMVGIGMDCETPDNGGDGTSEVLDATAFDWEVTLFPNPGQDLLTIQSQFGATNANPTFAVYNADGRLVMAETNHEQGADGTWLIDAGAWTPGMYIVHVTQNDRTRQLPWFKVR